MSVILHEPLLKKKSHKTGRYFRINFSKINNYESITNFLSLFAKRYNISYANLCWYCCNKGFENVIDKLQKHYENDKETERPKQSRSIIQSLKSSTQSFFDRFKDIDSLLSALKKGKVSYDDVTNHITRCRIITVGIDNTHPSLSKHNRLIDSKRDTKKEDTRIKWYKQKVTETLKEEIKVIPKTKNANIMSSIPEGYEEIPASRVTFSEDDHHKPEIKEEEKEEPAELFFSYTSTPEQIEMERQEAEDYKEETRIAKKKLRLYNEYLKEKAIIAELVDDYKREDSSILIKKKNERTYPPKVPVVDDLIFSVLEEEYNTRSGNQ